MGAGKQEKADGRGSAGFLLLLHRTNTPPSTTSAGGSKSGKSWQKSRSSPSMSLNRAVLTTSGSPPPLRRRLSRRQVARVHLGSGGVRRDLGASLRRSGWSLEDLGGWRMDTDVECQWPSTVFPYEDRDHADGGCLGIHLRLECTHRSPRVCIPSTGQFRLAKVVRCFSGRRTNRTDRAVRSDRLGGDLRNAVGAAHVGGAVRREDGKR